MTTYLPITAMWWLPDAGVGGPCRVIAPAGMPVHATVAGRVTLVDTQAVGAVVIRDADERFHHYRRLQASSITVAVDDTVDGGSLLGVIAPPSDASMPALLYGVRDAAERWVATDTFLLGAADPAELGVTAALYIGTDEVRRAPASGPVAAVATRRPPGPAPRGEDRPPAPPASPDAPQPPAGPRQPSEPARSRLAARRPPRRAP